MLTLHLAHHAFVTSLPDARLAGAFRARDIAMADIVEPLAGETTVTAPKPPYTVMRVGDDTLAGDFGFDPLLIADTPKKLAWFRECEIRHARLAMLAAVGWPLSELFDGPLAQTLGVQSALLSDGRAPSLLNGGLGNINSAYWGAVVALAVFVESKSLDVMFGKKPFDYLPGDLRLDPLKQDSTFFRTAEIQNGRVAMVAITVFALEEAVFKAPIVEKTSVFFKPVWELF